MHQVQINVVRKPNQTVRRKRFQKYQILPRAFLSIISSSIKIKSNIFTVNA